MTANHLSGPLVLVGLMATGKTTVGRILAAALAVPFFDSDEMVEARTGHTVAELWQVGGEPAFRGLETEALDDALAAAPMSVIAAAGGVVLAEANRRRLRATAAAGGIVVWLQADPALLATRVSPGDHRPLLAADPEGTLSRMAQDRDALYAEVADATVTIDHRAPADVADAVLAAVAEVIDQRGPSRRQVRS